jgi:hypothetical protein
MSSLKELLVGHKKPTVQTVIDMNKEYRRRQSQTHRLLRAFKEKGELTTADLQRIGTGCSSRLHELRAEGHVIVPVYEKPGMWRYVYKGQKHD